jgi:hypothetical protein
VAPVELYMHDGDETEGLRAKIVAFLIQINVFRGTAGGQ